MGEPRFLSVESAYDRWSAFYDRYRNPMVYIATQALLAGPAKLAEGKRVFEFGCGTGRNLAVFKDGGAALLAGCDLSPGMLSVAASRDLGARLFQHDFSLPLPSIDQRFDSVLFSLTLEHLESLVGPLREARKILAPGGRIHILEIHPYFSAGGVSAHFHDSGETVRMPTYAHEFAHYLNAFAEAGLTVARCQEWRPRDLGTPEPLLDMDRGPDFPMLVEFELTPAIPASQTP